MFDWSMDGFVGKKLQGRTIYIHLHLILCLEQQESSDLWVLGPKLQTEHHLIISTGSRSGTMMEAWESRARGVNR
jgi:hypothetical protein